MSKPKTHVKRGDTVEVIAGSKELKGKQGIVIDVDAQKQRVTLDGVRLVKKAVKRTREDQEGGIIEQNAPIAISNVKKIS